MNSSAAFFCFCIALFSAYKEEKASYSPLDITQELLLSYADRFFTTCAHEAGHAVTGRILNNDPITIHLGGIPENKTLIALGKTIMIDGLDPRKGYSEVRIGKNKSLKSSAILIAGGIAGIIAHTFFKAFKIILRNPEITFKSALRESITSFDLIYLDQLCNMLIPTLYEHSASDAYYLFEMMGIPSYYLDKIAAKGHDFRAFLDCFFYCLLLSRRIHEDDLSYTLYGPLVAFDLCTDHSLALGHMQP